MNDPILDEIHAVRRHHWLEAGGTWDGLCACYDRLSAEMAEKGPEAVFRDWLAARKRERMEREEAMGAVCVGEERAQWKECTMQNAQWEPGGTDGQTTKRFNGPTVKRFCETTILRCNE